MFRPMRRSKQQLSDEECLEILLDGKDGVLAVNGDGGYPYAVPLNYIYLNGCIYIHCAKQGHKLDAVKKDGRVSFCVVSENDILQQKFTALYKSVIVFGKAEIVEDEKEMYQAVRAIAEKYCPDMSSETENEIRRDWSGLCIVKIITEHISGKKCKEFL
ncbi:MAG: pyridoxamine 5'-phosphate oxidase family protein [Clostridia bacterium]|nr:pyridoxamine 5'-phosphate oxidase family protein [Clostridia bacterium]